MPISKESKEVLKREILLINDQLPELQKQLDIARQKKDHATEVFEKVRLQIEILKKKKQDFQSDIG